MNHLSTFTIIAILLYLSTYIFAQEFSCYEREEELMRTQIVGSSDSYTVKEIPWAVNLSFGGSPFCGGTLVNQDTVVTAAHCIRNNMTVRRVDEEGTPYGDALKVIDFAIHPNYEGNQDVSPADVAVLRLETVFDVSINDLPRLLPDDLADNWGLPNDCALVSGWGVTEEGGEDTSPMLLGISLPIWSDDACRASYGDTFFDGTICAGYQNGQVGSCQGDSGGSLVVRGGPTGFIHVGIVSFGVGCARPNYPTVYTRVSSYYDWILEAAENLE